MACNTMRPNVLRRATSAAGSKRSSRPASVKSNEAMLPHGLGREDKFAASRARASHTAPHEYRGRFASLALMPA